MRVPFPLQVLLGFFALVSTVPAKERWIQARTEHFEMFSSESEAESRRLLAKLEQFRAFLAATYALREAREPRTFVVVFASARAFDRYKPTTREAPDKIVAHVTADGDEVMMALTTDLDEDDTAEPDDVILREYVQVMLRARDVRVPRWLNEGLADLYSTFDVDGDKIVIGRAKAVFVNYLDNAPLLPLVRLAGWRSTSEETNDRARSIGFEAEAWALTHYLVCGAADLGPARLSRFMVAMNDAPDQAEQNFRVVFGLTSEQVDQRLQRYVADGEYVQRWVKVPLPDLEQRLTFRSVSDFERDVIMADVKWRMQKDGAVKATALALAQRQPDSPRPEELAAAIDQAGGDLKQAGAHWTRAAELNSENPFVYVQAARAAMAAFSNRLQLDAFPPDALSERIRGWLDRALVLDPDSAAAWEALAWTEAQARQMRVSAINRVQRAVPHLRDPTRTLYALAVVRWRTGDAATAAKLIDRVLASTATTPELRTAADDLKQRLASLLRVEEKPGAAKAP